MIFSLAPLAPLATTTRRTLSYVLLAALGFGLPIAPCLAAKTPKHHRATPKKEKPAEPATAEASEAPETAEAREPSAAYPRIPVNPNLPSEISIAPHFSAEQRQARQREEAERLRALAPRAAAWSQAFRTEGQPFARFVDETLRTLRTAVGRASRNVCYPLGVATERLAAALPEAPDTKLEGEIRSALARVANGARICLEGRPTTAQTEIRGGAEVFVRAAEAIVNWGR
ncbi:MAG TPA: hypothetical protein VGS22_01240 [Thermoanaerobaculia bacterium]|jgi:hypothetical protein|nr:hypothetical protein [Thermoanaerobaculia bacterium]